MTATELESLAPRKTPNKGWKKFKGITMPEGVENTDLTRECAEMGKRFDDIWKREQEE